MPDAPPPSPPRRPGVAATYIAVPLVTALLLVAGMRLEGHDLRMPIGYNGGDVLLILPMVQATHEAGTHWRHPRLGAPGEQDLRDFPVIDHLHFAGLRVLTAATGDVMTAFNGYYLLTYPLAALTSLYAFRRLGLGLAAAAAAAILYAFTPYHQMRNLGHYFLSAYFVVPLAAALALEIATGRWPFFTPVGKSQRFALGTRTALFAVVVAALTAAAGAYYAFFSCALFAFAGVYGAVAARSWKPAAAVAVVVAVVVAGGVIGHVPTILYHADAGRNSEPTRRMSEAAEEYGLKLAQLVLPIPGHRVIAAAAIRSSYDSPGRPVQTENGSSTLGLVGTVGLVVLVAALLLPGAGRLRPVAALTGFALLLATVGGLGALFNHLVSPQVRAYCRLSVFVGFYAVLTSAGLLDRLLHGRPRLTWAVFAAVVAFGMFDQTPADWFIEDSVTGRRNLAAEYQTDAAFYGQAEAVMPGGMVFCLPFIPFPESAGAGLLMGNDHARGVVHTRTVRWSFGAMKGREDDAWQREVAADPVPLMLDRLVLRGFDGLYVHRDGYHLTATADPARVLVAQVRQVLGKDAELAPHADGRRHLFDLRPYRAKRRAELGPAFAERADADADAVRILWLDGFIDPEPSRPAVHWWGRRTGEAVIVNPTARARTVHATLRLKSRTGGPMTLAVRGNVWSDDIAVTPDEAPYTVEWNVPPGRHAVQFDCPPPATWLPGDGQRVVFEVTRAVVADVSTTGR